jgi:hypothetical protein
MLGASKQAKICGFDKGDAAFFWNAVLQGAPGGARPKHTDPALRKTCGKKIQQRTVAYKKKPKCTRCGPGSL